VPPKTPCQEHLARWLNGSSTLDGLAEELNRIQLIFARGIADRETVYLKLLAKLTVGVA
jgi:hypothetical protein